MKKVKIMNKKDYQKFRFNDIKERNLYIKGMDNEDYVIDNKDPLVVWIKYQ